jgi:hypothetical protein
MTQPEALRLADALQQQTVWEGHYGPSYLRDLLPEAAAELRRLHAENEALREANEAFGKRQEWWNERMVALEQQRDALLEALKSTGLFLHHCWCDVQMNDYSFEKLNQQMQIVDAAIAKAEGEEA